MTNTDEIQNLIQANLVGEKAGEKVPNNVVDNVVDNEKEILNLLKSNPKLSATELAKKTNLSSRSIQRYLKLLREKKYIKRIGPAKGGHWKIINK